MIVGSINCEGYDFIDLRVICNCRTVISVNNCFAGAKPFNRENIHSILIWRDGVYTCRKCGRKILSVIDERVYNYSFNLICRCGEQYDSINNFRRRLGETMELLRDEPEFMKKNKE